MKDAKHANLVTLRDLTSNALVAISETHAIGHRGDLYDASVRTASIANNGTLNILIKTGANHNHFSAFITVGGDFYYDFYEDTTVSADGTPLTIFNKKRDSSNTPGTTMFTAPTVTNTGTLFDVMLVPGGTGGITVGGSFPYRTEWILKRNTTYLLRLTNKSGTAAPASCQSVFYEHVHAD